VVRITFIGSDGVKHGVEAQPGCSLMQAATANRVPGIIAECGGNCACGTCCVYVDEAWLEKTGQPSDMESATMEVREDATRGRRLSCQIEITQDLDGLVVRVPESQF
jgi:ferredoxin, 2Fe-2S